MGKITVDKLKHDFLNSIVIINNLAKYAKKFTEKLGNIPFDDSSIINTQQLELFQKSMDAIHAEALKIKINFFKAIGEEV